MTRKMTFLSIVLAMLIVMACTISSADKLSEAELLETAVAQTVAAKVAEEDDEPQALPTITLSPTATQKSAPTSTPKPCNKAEFISETIPDDTEFDPGETFTKSWRLKNIGTCTWNTSYKLVFASGDKLNGPDSVKLSQNVAPGEQVDISVDLKAPASDGTYKGFWKFVDEDGVNMFTNNVYVQIEVNPAPLNNYSTTIEPDVDEGGTVWSNGDVFPGEYYVGDSMANDGVQMFVAFDISSIPSDAVIQEVTVDFTDFITLFGNTFNSLGCLRLYPDPYRPLKANDYKTPPVTGADVKWCNTSELNSKTVEDDLADYLQERVGNPYMALRLQFNEKESDGSNDHDILGFASMSIDVDYKAP